MWAVVLCVLGIFGHASADCYPGDVNFTAIIQRIYQDVTSDRIVLAGVNQPRSVLNRQQLCQILTDHHNSGRNPGQLQTNSGFLGSAIVSGIACTDALTYTEGYSNITGWQQWQGHHSGHRYSLNRVFSEEETWHTPSYQSGTSNVLQSIRFGSQFRISNCVTEYDGTTCSFGWNQSGQGVRAIHFRFKIRGVHDMKHFAKLCITPPTPSVYCAPITYLLNLYNSEDDLPCQIRKCKEYVIGYCLFQPHWLLFVPAQCVNFIGTISDLPNIVEISMH